MKGGEIIKKFFNFVKRNSKTVIMSMTMSTLAVLSAVGASATDGTTTSLQDSFSSALSTIQSDVLGYIAIALPVGLAVFGAILAIKKGISFIRCLIGKS